MSPHIPLRGPPPPPSALTPRLSFSSQANRGEGGVGTPASEIHDPDSVYGPLTRGIWGGGVGRPAFELG